MYFFFWQDVDNLFFVVSVQSFEKKKKKDGENFYSHIRFFHLGNSQKIAIENLCYMSVLKMECGGAVIMLPY